MRHCPACDAMLFRGDGPVCADCAERVFCFDHGYRRSAPLDGRCDVCDRELVREGEAK